MGISQSSIIDCSLRACLPSLPLTLGRGSLINLITRNELWDSFNFWLAQTKQCSGLPSLSPLFLSLFLWFFPRAWHNCLIYCYLFVWLSFMFATSICLRFCSFKIFLENSKLQNDKRQTWLEQGLGFVQGKGGSASPFAGCCLNNFAMRQQLLLYFYCLSSSLGIVCGAWGGGSGMLFRLFVYTHIKWESVIGRERGREW